MLSSLVDSMKTKYTEVSVNFIFLVNDEKEEEKSPLFSSISSIPPLDLFTIL